MVTVSSKNIYNNVMIRTLNDYKLPLVSTSLEIMDIASR